MNTNSYTFTFSEEKDEKIFKFNIGPLVFGTIALVSHFYFNSNIDQTIAQLKASPHSIQSFNLIKPKEEQIVYPLHKNQLDDSDNLYTINFSNNDIIKSDTNDESEVLNMEELSKFQEKFDVFSDKNHEMQLKMTETLAILNTEMASIKNELSRMNKTQEALPSTIRDELVKIKSEKSDSVKTNWLAPTITGIVIGIVLLIGEFLLNLL